MESQLSQLSSVLSAAPFKMMSGAITLGSVQNFYRQTVIDRVHHRPSLCLGQTAAINNNKPFHLSSKLDGPIYFLFPLAVMSNEHQVIIS